MGIRVKEIMDRNPIIIDASQTVFGLRELVILRQPECVLVTDAEKRLVGIMTPSHLATISDVDIEEKVTAVMEQKFRRVNCNMSVREAAAMLSASELEALPVVDNNDELVGVVTYKDIVKDLVEDREDQLLTPESAVIYLSMTKDPEQEEYWLQKVSNKGYRAAITQVGATAEKLFYRQLFCRKAADKTARSDDCRCYRALSYQRRLTREILGKQRGKRYFQPALYHQPGFGGWFQGRYCTR